MPDMDGVACLKALRNFGQYREAGNIVALTAYALPREKSEFIKQGFIDLITKPLDEAKLQAIILRYLPETQRIDSPAPIDSPELIDSHEPAKDHEREERLTLVKSPQPIDSSQLPGDSEHLPIFDWAESVHLSNGNESLAREFAQKLFLTLPEAKKDISTSFKANDKTRLLHSVHKLHGVTLLCGIPKLRYLAYRSEDSLKTNQDESSLNTIIEQLLEAVEELIECGDHVLATHAPAN